MDQGTSRRGIEKSTLMKINYKGVVRTTGMIICFILACLIVNYIMVHLPDFIRCFKKPKK